MIHQKKSYTRADFKKATQSHHQKKNSEDVLRLTRNVGLLRPAYNWFLKNKKRKKRRIRSRRRGATVPPVNHPSLNPPLGFRQLNTVRGDTTLFAGRTGTVWRVSFRRPTPFRGEMTRKRLPGYRHPVVATSRAQY